MEKDLYQILEVSPGADLSEIKKSYRRLAKQYHPDRNPDNPDAERMFKELCGAYEILSDEEKRKKYDADRTKQSTQKTSRNKTSAQAPFDFSAAQRSMEEFFGFAANPGSPSNGGKKQGNPLDTTELFERFMGMKR